MHPRPRPFLTKPVIVIAAIWVIGVAFFSVRAFTG